MIVFQKDQMSDSHLPQKFVEVYQIDLPEILYHYTDQNGLLGIIERSEMWATKVQYMNDATEFGAVLDLACTRLEYFSMEKCYDTSTQSFKVACA